MKEALRKYVLSKSINKNKPMKDITQVEIDAILQAFTVEERVMSNGDKALKIVISNWKTIEYDRIKDKLKKAKFTSFPLPFKLSKERISKLYMKVNHEIVPYALLPLDIFESNGTYIIN